MEAYRVRKQFQWDGWQYAPRGQDGECKCGCIGACTQKVGTSCHCHDTACHCACGIQSDSYAGDTWIVEPGHPHKEHMLVRRFATYDAGLPSVDELIQKGEYKKLLSPYQPKRKVRA